MGGGGSRMNEVACALDGCACRFPPWPDGLLAVLPVPVAVLLLLVFSVEVGIVAEQSIPGTRGQGHPCG